MTQEEFSRRHLSHLNPQQKQAVQAAEGAILLLAVPGSGKTTVLVTRLGYLVYCKRIEPESILTMTYTVAATEEMKNRFTEMFGSEFADRLEFRTINGLSAKIIEYYSRNHGRGRPFQLLSDGSETARMVSLIHQKTTGEFASPSTVRDVCTAITYIKNMMLSEAEVKSLDLGVPKLPEIFEAYCRELRSRRLMDFDDQMKYALDILVQKPEVLQHFQARYQYLCVDEAQDTSKIQHAIIKLLSEKNGNLFLVGDEDQSIYGFRAAYPDALMKFKGDHPGAQVLLIEENYRSTPEIVSAANAFVRKNRYRHDKKIMPVRSGGGPVRIIGASDREAQYKYLFEVAKDCDRETAVLFRNNDSALPLIDLLDKQGIPYRCRQFDGAFFSHSVVSDLTDIINFAYDPYDGEIFLRIYYKFGSPLSKKAAVYACDQTKISGRTILEELMEYPELKGYAKEGVSDLKTLLERIVKSSGEKAIQQIKASGYGYYVDTKGLDAGKIEIMRMLGKGQASARDLLKRLSEIQQIIAKHNDEKGGSFILSTIHSSKGLEYDTVYLLDILDGILPSKPISDKSSAEEVKEYEEARRLFYVGMTRAKNSLNVFRCPSADSAFIQEIAGSGPSESFEADSIFAAVSVDLLGKTYIHKEKGQARVIAQSGPLLLVEYEDARCDLVNIVQLHDERKVVLKQEDKPSFKPVKKTSHRKAGPAKYAAQDPKVLSSRLICGARAVHVKYGEGIVEANDGTAVTIRFKGSGKVKKFNVKVAAEQGLIAV